jgi:ubiquinone/menaquinone biosynthesis C-methylase UbiE
MENKPLLKQQQDSQDVNKITRSYAKQRNDSLDITDEQADRLMEKAFIGALRYDDGSKALQVCYGVVNGVLKWKAITYQ